MKLKYILPVATIASVATIVTPLVTSCGKNTNTYTYEHDKTFVPLDPRKAMTITDNNDLTEKYHEDLLKNKGIFANDIVNVIGNQDGEYGQVVTKVTYTTTDVSKEMESYTDPDTNAKVEYFRVSFDVYMDAAIKMSSDKDPISFNKRTASVKNLPIKFSMDPNGVCSDMSFSGTEPNIDLGKDQKWSANLPKAKADDIGIEDTNADYSYKEYSGLNPWESGNIAGMLTKMIQIDPSNYYRLVTKA